MPERIYKLQPNRSMQLRGFDDLGASAALHSATSNSFKVSGVFRDPADFAVLVLYDADNFYDHPRLKPLPDTNFRGLTLSFDVHYQGLMPLDSPKYPTIDWPFLDVLRPDGTSAQIKLFDHAVQAGGTYTAASAHFVVQDNGLKEYDRLTLWYLNNAFDYIVPKVECAYTFLAAGAGTVHAVTVAGTPFTYTEVAGDSDAAVAAGLVTALGACPDVTASRGDGTAESGAVNQVNLRAKKTDGAAFTVSSTGGGAVYTLYGVGAATVAAALASMINGTNWTAAGTLIPLQAEASGATLTVRAARKGVDGNMITMYAVWKNERLRTAAPVAAFSGGSSDAIWRVTLDFQALGIPEVRLMWLTFAPPLANGSAFTDTEWQATFTHWTLSGPEQVRALQVALPDSARWEEHDTAVSFTGAWALESGFYSEGYARRATQAGDTVTIAYQYPHTHDLYLGTSLYTDRSTVGVKLDGDAETDLNCRMQNEPAVVTRRKLRSGVPGGAHTVTIRLKTAGPFYFDFLEAVIAGDVPDALPGRPRIAPALDYSTDHSYKLPPARVMWILDKLGFTGPMNQYIGVFWWNSRRRVGAVIPTATVTFSGTFEANDQVFISIGGQTCGKTILHSETPESVARHFAWFINATYVGVWAAAAGNILTITARSPKPAYAYTFSAWKEASASSGAVTTAGSLQGGQPGKWEIDAEAPNAINRGARDWHADLYRECASRGREIVTAQSMELVLPPAGFAALYPDGQAVETDVGFASLKSTHCSFIPAMLAYQKKVYKELADLMAAAGLTPNLQFGEFLWWFFTNYSGTNPQGGMAFYDDETKAAAQLALGRPLHVFRRPTDDPGVNGGADAAFLRGRLRDHVAALIAHVRATHPTAKFEVLFPYDVNHPQPAGVHQLGGRLNRFVNFPVEWEQKATAGFDRLKTEALDFGAWSRNLDLARTAILFPIELGWPRDSVRHLVPCFTGAYPWHKEVNLAMAQNLPAVNLWAFDHICLYGWPPEEVMGLRRSAYFG